MTNEDNDQRMGIPALSREEELERQLAEAQAALARALEGLKKISTKYGEPSIAPKGPWILSGDVDEIRAILASPGAEASAKWLEEQKAEAVKDAAEAGMLDPYVKQIEEQAREIKRLHDLADERQERIEHFEQLERDRDELC